MSTGRSTTIRDKHRAIIRRRGEACGICTQPIDYRLPYLDPGEFVVDHILPLNKGGLDVIENKQAAHRSCNRAKGDRTDYVARRVLLLCGPPGAGKTTMAHESGLPVYDLDDERWHGSDRLFREALAGLASDPSAKAAVIRSGATLSARRKAATLCGATETVVLAVEQDVCVERVVSRNRQPPSIAAQIAAIAQWWQKYEPGETSAVPVAPLATSRAW